MTGRGMRRRGLGHASAAADCLVPHSLARHSLPRRPHAPLPNAHGLPVGWLRSSLPLPPARPAPAAAPPATATHDAATQIPVRIV
jgi:hypothetical protein